MTRIPGTTKLHRLEENLGAADVDLTTSDLREIEGTLATIEVQGARLPEAAQAHEPLSAGKREGAVDMSNVLILDANGSVARVAIDLFLQETDAQLTLYLRDALGVSKPE